MTIEARKLELVNYILQINNEETLMQLKTVLDNQVILQTVDGGKINKAQYFSEIRDAENQIKSGDFIEHEVIKKEIAQW